MKADNRRRRYVRKTKQRFASRLAYVPIDRDRGKRLASLCQARLVVFGDVNACFAEQSSNATNHPWNIIIGKNQQRITRLNIHVEGSNPCEAGSCARLRCSGNRDLLHTTAQSHFDRNRVVLHRDFGCRKVDPASFGYRASVDEIEPLLFPGSFKQTASSRREKRALRGCQT